MSYSRANTIGTVARREIQVALRSKSIITSFVITLVVAIGAIGVLTWLSGREESTPAVVVVGAPEEAFTGFEVTSASDRNAAMTEVTDGDADAALILDNSGAELISDGSANPAIAGAAQAYLDADARGVALEAVGVSPEEYNAAFSPLELTLTDVGQEANMPAMLTVLAGIGIIFFFIMLFAGNIGGRVTEEKASRIVEIILSSVRPLDFLAGKLVGNLIVGLLGSAIFLAVTGIALLFSGLLDGVEFSWSVLPLLIVSFVVGLLFFGSLYAAAGSMVSRAEDLQSTQSPILFLVFAVIYSPFFGIGALDSTVMQILAWVPPTSLSVAPLQFAAGNFSFGMALLAQLIGAVVTVGILALVSRIYHNAILRNGQKVKWRTAITS